MTDAHAAPDARRGRAHGLLLLTCLVVALGIIAYCAITSAASSEDDKIAQVTVIIDYDDHWYGSLGGIDSSASYEGTGPASYTISHEGDGALNVAAVIQKSDGSPGTLAVSIETMDGTVLRAASTNAAYGSVTVGWIDP